MELKHSKQTLIIKERDLKSNDSAYLKDKEVIAQTEKEIKNFENGLTKINYQDGSLEELMGQKDNLTKECRGLRAEIDRFGKFEFNYEKPTADWDKRRVKGVASSLFRMKDQKYSRALSTAIGGRWRDVVTDNDETGKLLLERGKLQQRTTIIPMSKINGRTLDHRVVNLAQRLVGKENAIPAIDLIEYEKDVEPAMKYLFGSTFICKDLDSAKKVTYNKDIRTRSITLDGDSMDPEGSLSGGSVQKGMPILEEAARYNHLKRQYDEKVREINEIAGKIASLQQVAEQYKGIKDKLDNCQIQLRTAQDRLQRTTFQQNQDEINELKAKVLHLEKTIEECRVTKTQNDAKVKDLDSKLADSAGHREREVKAAEAELKKTKQKHEQSRQNWQKREQEYETLKMEIEELKKTLAESQEQIAAIEKQIEEMSKKIEDTNNTDGDFKKRAEELRVTIKKHKEQISNQNKEIRSKATRKEKLLKNNTEIELEIKKKENEIVKVKADNTEGYNKIKGFEEKYPWIQEDKKHFGAKNTRYDYTKEDPAAAGRKLHQMQENKEKLSRNINQEAMVLLEKEEEHYKKIVERRSKIENDRKKIIDSIKNMDSKKVEDLKKAWEEVNANFGSIFSTLLPGTQAKLVPPEGATFLKGLEVKVGFNGIWKESLTELSGGQRSLVALSLILAMLKYKPAPLYILDEVDAALDLSHTQNIGGMLKAHFKNSQFIIVSLKDGMFNNANVLFRTKFVDGVSGVVRTVNRNA
jgi:structural maintenance of chromosome 2